MVSSFKRRIISISLVIILLFSLPYTNNLIQPFKDVGFPKVYATSVTDDFDSGWTYSETDTDFVDGGTLSSGCQTGNCYNISIPSDSYIISANTYAQITKDFAVTTTGWHNASIYLKENGFIGSPIGRTYNYYTVIILINSTIWYVFNPNNQTDNVWGEHQFYFYVPSGTGISFTVRLKTETAIQNSYKHLYIDTLTFSDVTGTTVIDEDFSSIDEWTAKNGRIGTGLMDEDLSGNRWSIGNSSSSWQARNLTQSLGTGITGDFLLIADFVTASAYDRFHVTLFRDITNASIEFELQDGSSFAGHTFAGNAYSNTGVGGAIDRDLEGGTTFQIMIERRGSIITMMTTGTSEKNIAFIRADEVTPSNLTFTGLEIWTGVWTLSTSRATSFNITTFSSSSTETPNLNLHVLAADGSTHTSDLSETYVSLENSSGIFQFQVSGGWANFTGLTANANVNITAQIFNTTSNSFVKVNSSDMVSINVTETMNRDLVLDVYQNVTWSFIKVDGSAFTPDFLEVTFGNNGTKANVTSSSVFLNGSNTINRIYWQGGNVKNASTTFEVSSDSQVFVFEGQIYRVSYIFKRADATTYSPDNMTITAPNSTSIAISSYSNIYQQNGTWTPSTIYVHNQNVRHNVSDTYSPSTDSLSLDYITKVYDFAVQGRGLTDTTLSGVTYDVILPNSTVLTSLSADSNGLYSVGYVGNGSLTITGYWQTVAGNSSFVHSLTADGTLSFILQVGKDSSSNFRFIVGSGKFKLEELTGNYKVEPPWIIINSTYYTTGNHTGWAYDSGTHVLSVTDSDFEQSTLHDISWSLGSVLLTFNATGTSSETLLKVSWAGVVVPGGDPAPAPSKGGGDTPAPAQRFSLSLSPDRYVAYIGETTTHTIVVDWTDVTTITVTQVNIMGVNRDWVKVVTTLPHEAERGFVLKVEIIFTVTVPDTVESGSMDLTMNVDAVNGGASAMKQMPFKVALVRRGEPVSEVSDSVQVGFGDYGMYMIAALGAVIITGVAIRTQGKADGRPKTKLSRKDS